MKKMVHYPVSMINWPWLLIQSASKDIYNFYAGDIATQTKTGQNFSQKAT